MKLCFKFKPVLNELQLNIINELSFHTTALYNIANYDCINDKPQSYYDMNKKYSHNWHKNFLHSHTYQHCLKVLEKNWKSYFASIKDYKKNPSKYLGCPRSPKYKNNNDKKNEIIFTNLAIRFKDNTLMLSLSKSMQSTYGVKSLNFEVSDKLQSLVDFNNLQQIKIKWDSVVKEWYLIIIYNKQEYALDSSYSNTMAIDLGLNNLATLTFLDSSESYIINGKPVKAANSYINKEISKLQSIEMKCKKTSKIKDTKAITRLRRYRTNYMNNYFHKSSTEIVNKALQHKCNTIVIGDIKGIKQNMDFNKNFVQIPIQRLAELIMYKAQLQGIEVLKVKENYTSGCSAIDLEDINKTNYNKTRRVYRGLFKTNTDLLVNADVNGSLNILRLYIKDKCIPRPLIEARDNGYVSNPIMLRVA